MGQKTNPNIFRLGINKTWKTEFFEKKRHELSLYTFKDLEIKSYIERFLETHKILIHDYKQHYDNSTLYIYISYFVLPDFILNKKLNNNIVLLNQSKEKKIVSLNNVKNQNTIACLSKNNLQYFDKFKLSSNSVNNPYKIKSYIKENKTFLQSNNITSNEILNLKIEGLLNNMFKVLSLFNKNNCNIVINFCCLNKNLTFLKNIQKKNFMLLQKFRGTPFLKEGRSLMFHVVYNRNSANMLAKFIAMQIKKVKRHKFFLSFLKQTLTVLLNSNLSKVRGVKIIVKGRLNGVPRAKHKIISVGDVPVQSLNVKMDYSQTTAHNSNGSYGIKVWIVEKD
uniref:Ribosomal protein S3 n=1 Tax=Tryblionella apiculata TaxID=1003145 RepID=A0A8F0WIN8_9STRA|nr:ribosomal protein S3 [Tryblionella apiculata]QWM93611.1 ribosomal protein S3 [Tryblionella apiculata]